MPHTFIDESGAFLPRTPARPKVSCVGAVIVASRLVPQLLAEFTKVSASLPLVDGEVKGSRLNEAQVASVIAILERFDALAEVIAIDAGAHSDRDVTAFKIRQADLIGRHALTNPDPRVQHQAAELRDVIAAMPSQLFIQSFLTMQLVERVLQTCVLYFATRAPRELGTFTWVSDAKAATNVTPAEAFWSTFVLPAAEERFRSSPLRLDERGDYSHFRKYMQTQPGGQPGKIELPRIFSDNLSFRDSASEPGLQLADVVASAAARAFNGHLGEPGWEGLSRLLVGVEPQVVRMTHMRPWANIAAGGRRRYVPEGRYARVMRRLYSTRPLLIV
jgi:uncharacterized protein DUF3800